MPKLNLILLHTDAAALIEIIRKGGGLFSDGDYSDERVPEDIQGKIRAKLGCIPHCPLNPAVGYAYKVSSDRHSIVFCCFEHGGIEVDDPLLYAGHLNAHGCLVGVHQVPPAKRVDARGLQFGPYGRLDLDITSFATVAPSDYSRL